MSRSNGGKRFIFVGGAPRSGTTLVKNMIETHPDISGGPEFLHLNDIITLRNKLHSSIAKKWINLYCSKVDVDNFTAQLIENLLLPFANKYPSKYYCEKTPQNVLVFKELIALFPEARFIHVVRDPRAIISSMLKVGERAKNIGINSPKFTLHLNEAIKYTERCLTLGLEAANEEPEKVKNVIYEKLVTDPKNETIKICRFLDIEYFNEMIYPENKFHIGREAITKYSGEIWYNKNNYSKNPEISHIKKWERYLTPLQQAIIFQSFKNNSSLLKIGYNFDISRKQILQYKLFYTYSKIIRYLKILIKKLF
jgi:hypothetical protein